jgi:hypothetical protein
MTYPLLTYLFLWSIFFFVYSSFSQEKKSSKILALFLHCINVFILFILSSSPIDKNHFNRMFLFDILQMIHYIILFSLHTYYVIENQTEFKTFFGRTVITLSYPLSVFMFIQ